MGAMEHGRGRHGGGGAQGQRGTGFAVHGVWGAGWLCGRGLGGHRGGRTQGRQDMGAARHLGSRVWGLVEAWPSREGAH